MKNQLIVIGVLGVAAIVGMVIVLSSGSSASVTVGSKHFTEQKILGEMVAQLIEANTNLTVQRRLGLQGTKVCDAALRRGDLDIYPDYTGTGLIDILGEKYDPAKLREEILQHVRDEFRKRWNIEWLDPLGFANTYAFAMRKDQAEQLGIKKISDLKDHVDEIRPGFDHEYTTRPEFKRLPDLYGFRFTKKVTKLDPDITYKALKDKEVDLIDAFSTDGRIAAYNLVVLEDDKHLFPPYDACILVRADTLKKYPRLRPVLDNLSGAITPAEMRKMNFAVTNELRSPAAVAAEFLKRKGLVQ